jgi:hypothetical protein
LGFNSLFGGISGLSIMPGPEKAGPTYTIRPVALLRYPV